MPRQRNLLHLHAVLLRQFVYASDNLHILFFRAVVLAHGHAVGFAAKGIRVPGRAGQVPCGQRAVGDQAYAHLFADGNQLALVLAVEQVIVILHRLKPRPAVVARRDLHVIKLIAVHRGRAERAHFSRLNQIVQRFHGLLDGRFIIKAVDDVQIEVIRTQTLETAVDFPVNRLAGKPAGVKINLRSNDHLIAGNVFSERLSQIFLARPGGIAVGRIEEIDSQIERMPDHGFGGALVQRPVVHRPCLAKAHAAHADPGNFNLRPAQLRVFHSISPFTLGHIDCNRIFQMRPIHRNHHQKCR